MDNAKVCDKILDCPNGNDEKGCFINQCADRKLNSCSQLCINLRQGYRCSCRKGYKIQSDGKTCVDIDECESSLLNNCTQICLNTEGSYKCSCHIGIWDSATVSCKLTGKYGNAKLLFSSKSEIRMMTLNNKFYDVLQKNGRHFFSVDYLNSTGSYFWLDTQPGLVLKSGINDPLGTKQVVSIELPSPYSLAVDWVGNNMYVTDTVLHSISVLEVKGSSHKTLLVDHVNQPRALALCPHESFLFYTVINSIARVGMDGTGFVKIISDENIISPKGIAVDVFARRIYWTDSYLRRIETSDFDGKNRKVLIDRLSFPCGIAVFGDNLFWSDLRLGTINQAHKVSGLSMKVLKNDVDAVYSLKVMYKVLNYSLVLLGLVL